MAWKVPDQAGTATAAASGGRRRYDSLDASVELGCGSAREGREHNALRIRAGKDQRRDPVREHRGLPRACAGNDKKRRRAAGLTEPMLDRALSSAAALARISARDMDRGETCFLFCSKGAWFGAIGWNWAGHAIRRQEWRLAGAVVDLEGQRSTRDSCRSIATPKHALPPEAVLRLSRRLIALDVKRDLLLRNNVARTGWS